MDHIRSSAFEHSRHLPNHHRLMKNAFQFFHQKPGVIGGFIQGAAATGGLHPFSDLEFGIVCQTSTARDLLWATRSNWKIAPWIQFAKTDSSSTYHTTYLSQPSIHLDFRFYTLDDLPSPTSGPYSVVWDHSGQVDHWAQEMKSFGRQKANWSEVVSEDEQFWVWTHYSASFAARGEFHDVISHLEDLRDIVQNWQARLDQMARQNIRKTGNRFHPEFLDRMKRTFCPPHAEGVKLAFQNLIKIQLQQRALIDRTVAPAWTVTPPTISKIQTFSQTFMNSKVAAPN